MPAKGARPRDPEVGHLVPRQPRGRAAGGDGDDLRLVGATTASRSRWSTCARSPRCAPARSPPSRRRSWRARTPRTVGIVGCGLHGAWAARCLAAAEYGPGVLLRPRPRGRRARWPASSAGRRARCEDALACDVVTCVTPGRRAGGARRGPAPGRCTSTCSAPTARARPRPSSRRWPGCELFCDEWQQASHGGELTGGGRGGPRVARAGHRAG